MVSSVATCTPPTRPRIALTAAAIGAAKVRLLSSGASANAAAWNEPHARYEVKRIHHQACSRNGARTNCRARLVTTIVSRGHA